MECFNKSANEYYELAKQESITGEKKEYKPEIIKISKENLKRRLSSIFVAGLVIGSIVGATSNLLHTDYSDNSIVLKYINDNKSIVTANTKRTEDNEGCMYDTDEIGFSLSTQEDSEIDTLIYSVFANFNHNVIKNMDDVMSSLSMYVDNDSEFKQYKSFEDYLIKKDFIDSNNEISTDEYIEYMKEYIIAKEKMETVKGMKQ